MILFLGESRSRKAARRTSMKIGGAKGIRTPDPPRAVQARKVRRGASAIAALFDLREQPVDDHHEHWDSCRSGLPHHAVVDYRVRVSEHVSHADNPCQIGYGRGSIRVGGTEILERVAKDFKLALHSRLAEFVLALGRLGEPRDERTNQFGRGTHIPQECGRLRTQTLPARCRRPTRRSRGFSLLRP